jgi:hypothetical protein
MTCIRGKPNEQTRNFDQAFVGMYAAMGSKGDLGFSGLRCCGGAESVDAADALLRERMVDLEASQASAGSQLSSACLPVEIRCVCREIWLLS